MSQTTILIMQGIGITLQVINAGLSGVLPATATAHLITLCVAAMVGGYQFVVQHVGNQSNPNNGKNGNGGTKP